MDFLGELNKKLNCRKSLGAARSLLVKNGKIFKHFGALGEEPHKGRKKQ